MANKIKYGLSKVYYALATISSVDGSATYGAPVAMPGAVSLSLEPSGDPNIFYADNIPYMTFAANAGYEGTLELALIPDAFRTDVLGEVTDADVQYETTTATTAPFALLFQFEGDDTATRHVLYNCTATRPNVGSQTTEESVEVQTEELSLTCGAIYNASLDKNLVKGKVSDDTAAAYSSWFTAVVQPS